MSVACAPQKVDPALIARVRPTIVGCFWPVFFFADHRHLRCHGRSPLAEHSATCWPTRVPSASLPRWTLPTSHVEVIDLLGNKVEAELGVSFFVAAYSVLRKAPPQPGLLVLGDMSVQGNVKPVRSLTEPLQVAMDNGAKRALIPIENKRQFLEVTPDILEHVDPIFYGELRQAAFKALGLN